MAEREGTASGGIVAGDARTGFGPRPIAATLDRLIARSGYKRGFGEAGMLVDWTAIVGERIGQCTIPERLARSREGKPSTLHLRVAVGWATEVQHLEPVILERINGYLGYQAVGRLALRQGSMKPPPTPRRPALRPLTEAEERALSDAAASVENPDLAEALRDLGRAVRGAEKARAARTARTGKA